MKLCVIYNFQQIYRKGIFQLIDKKWHPTWVFGDTKTDIKGFDPDSLKNMSVVHNYFFGPFYWQKGAVKIMSKHDVVLSLGEPFCLSTWVILLLRRTIYNRKKVFLWSHGWYGRENRLKRLSKKYFFALSDMTFLYGNHAKDIARAYGYKKNNLRIIHNSLDYDTQVRLRNETKNTAIYTNKFGNTHPTIIFIGRLTTSKRLDILIRALHILKSKNHIYNLCIVGDGSVKNQLIEMANEYNLADHTWFYGANYEERINATLIKNADLCVSPGNVGLTAIHAMMYGTPVITHDEFAWQGPEFEAIKPSITGDFFKRYDEESLATTIQLWFDSHQGQREQTRLDCYNEIDSFWTPQYQIKVLEQEFAKL